MSRFEYDLLTIGAGSGGVAASRRAAAHGAKVAICEEGRVGGTCVIRGCVPKKLLVYGSSMRDTFEDARGFGWSLDRPVLHWAGLIAAKDRETHRLEGIYRRLLRDAPVEVLEGHAEFKDPHTVTVGERAVTAETILIATGGWPHRPEVPGIEHAITSNEALDLPQLPHRVLVVGGGYIGCEFASIFRSAGAEVVQAVRADTILRGFDPDVRASLAQEMGRRGIDLRTEERVESLEKVPEGISVLFHGGETLTVAAVLYATGRRPNTADLGLERAGLSPEAGGQVRVDEYSRTAVDHIYAVGDVTDRMALTPVAIVEGRAFADTVFGGQDRPVRHDNVPHAVFAQPPASSVGLTEQAAREAGYTTEVYRSSFRPMKHTLSGREERSMMKLVVDGDTDRVLGAHMVGMDAPEIIQGVAIALTAGATKAQFDATVAIHPTSAEEFVLMREALERPSGSESRG